MRTRSQKLIELLEHVTYKEGYHLEIIDPEPAIIGGLSFGDARNWPATLAIKFTAKDTRGKFTEPRELAFSQVIPQHIHDAVSDGRNDLFYWYVHECLRNLEMHELDEWYKIDGHMWNDPHGEVKPWKEVYVEAQKQGQTGAGA